MAPSINMKYFNKYFRDFFVQLSCNNHKDWFHAHKDEYENYVKFPFEKFILDLITEISKYENLNQITPKDCILRINKDIRFSKDKSPYNTHVTAFVSKGGGKDKSIPGIFLRFSHESIGIMGGCYSPSPSQLEIIRKCIEQNQREFQKLKTNNDFIKRFKRIQGEAIKRIPDSLKEISITEPQILNKQWYFVADRKPELLFSSKLLPEIMNYYFAAKPLNDFLIDAISFK